MSVAEPVRSITSLEIEVNSRFVAPGYSGGALASDAGFLIGMIVRDEPPLAVATRFDIILERLTGWGLPIRLAQAPFIVILDEQRTQPARRPGHFPTQDPPRSVSEIR